MAIKTKINEPKIPSFGSELSSSTNKEKRIVTDTFEGGKVVKTKKVCQFCEAKTLPSFTDSQALRRYLSERAKIRPKSRTGVCSKHQRQVTKQIKYARHLSLLPFVARI